MKSDELDFVVVVELLTEVEQGIEEFFERGGVGNAYEAGNSIRALRGCTCVF